MMATFLEYKILDEKILPVSIFFGGDAHAQNSVKFFETQGYKILKKVSKNEMIRIILGKELMTEKDG